MKLNAPPGTPPWLYEAYADIGVAEIPGAANHPRIMEMLKATTGFRLGMDETTAWCSAAVNKWLADAGFEGTNSLWALHFSDWGDPAYRLLGSIAVMRRKDAKGNVIGGHVGFVVKTTRWYVWLINGNSLDSVRITKFPRKRIIAFRHPAGYMQAKIPPVAVAKLPIPSGDSGYGGSET